MFDPYRKWLGIPEHQRPPTHYQILGIAPDEKDLDVIEAAVLRQSAFVRNFQAGAHAEEATRILNEIAAARLCLIDTKKRAKYDAELVKRDGPKPASQSSARHSDLGIDVGSAVPSQRAPQTTPSQRAPSAVPEMSPPTIDLDRLLAPPSRRGAPVGRRTSLGSPRGRPRAPQSSIGYVWQVPLLAVICVILVLVARTIGQTIADQRAKSARPVQIEFQDERERR